MAINQSQQHEINSLVKSKVLTASLIIFAILGGITGIGLWVIHEHIEAKINDRIANQFADPTIKKVVQEAAAEQGIKIMAEQVQPEIDLFRVNAGHRLTEVNDLTEKTRTLQQESLGIRDRIIGVQSDLVKIQKCVAKIQYLTAKGKDQNPNPYQAEITQTLNDLVAIAIPDKAERTEFIKELDGAKP